MWPKPLLRHYRGVLQGRSFFYKILGVSALYVEILADHAVLPKRVSRDMETSRHVQTSEDSSPEPMTNKCPQCVFSKFVS